ncbi:hypothetical protein I317_05886 [Kwoniella heveanensis CBS 569]|nr:hypothetical protein I317_05886 [Kwoniella heveanensis CBS 569]
MRPTPVILGITTVVLLALYIRHRHQKKKAQREREAKEESEKRQKQLEEDLLKAGAEKERRKLQDRKTLHEVELKLMEAGIDPKELRKSRGGDD